MLQTMKKLFSKPQKIIENKGTLPPYLQSYLYSSANPVWSERCYSKFATEGYIQNVVAYRSISLIATGAASVKWKLFALDEQGKKQQQIYKHKVLELLARPNHNHNHSAFIEALISYRMISGNAYILAVGPYEKPPVELHLLRPDRVSIIANNNGYPTAYRYKLDGNSHRDYRINSITGRSQILHLKAFHPLNDYYGLSPVEAAAYSIDIHNDSSSWNKALLQNAARPSGALVVKTESGHAGRLSEDQYWRIKQQIDEQFTGGANAGRPLLLEGGLDWKEMSHSPKDMDYLNARHSAARDIALAFGVAPQLLGIPGDNTYANLAEARLAVWEQTILPIMQNITDALNDWLLHYYPERLQLEINTDGISALALRQEKLWQRVQNATFLSDDEKREIVGVSRVKR